MLDMPVGNDTLAHRRYLPHLEKLGKTYFVTFCTAHRWILPPTARDIALACWVHDHELTYCLYCAVVMPDHVHTIFTPFGTHDLATMIDRVKGVSSHAEES